MPREYGFDERLQMSQGICATKSIADVLMANIPGAQSVAPATRSEDRNGTDYWVNHARGKPYSIDVKVRADDWAAKPEPNRADDLALESWSVVEQQIVGWTRNPKKMTDYILWYWQDSGRWCLVPFVMLCAVMEDKWEAWRAEYKTRRQSTPSQNGGYHSECIFVPRREVWAEIYKRFSGSQISGEYVKSILEPKVEPKTLQEKFGW